MRNHMYRFFWVFLGVIVFVVVAAVVLNAIFLPRYYPAGTSPYPYGMMWGWGMGSFWGFGAIMMLIPLILLVFFVLWIVDIARGSREYDGYNDHAKTALEILNERYASGSITREEYNRMKEEITRK